MTRSTSDSSIVASVYKQKNPYLFVTSLIDSKHKGRVALSKLVSRRAISEPFWDHPFANGECLPGYSDIVKEPMWMIRAIERYEGNAGSVQGLVNDIHLMFQNCVHYTLGTRRASASKLLEDVEELYAIFCAELKDDEPILGNLSPLSRPCSRNESDDGDAPEPPLCFPPLIMACPQNVDAMLNARVLKRRANDDARVNQTERGHTNRKTDKSEQNVTPLLKTNLGGDKEHGQETAGQEGAVRLVASQSPAFNHENRDKKRKSTSDCKTGEERIPKQQKAKAGRE
jgi:hypothetical protein